MSNETAPCAGLPMEVWLQIFGSVDRDDWPRCAAVCKLWQVEFECRTFSNLLVRSNDLWTFYKIMCPRRQQDLKSLAFCVQIPDTLHFSDEVLTDSEPDLDGQEVDDIEEPELSDGENDDAVSELSNDDEDEAENPDPIYYMDEKEEDKEKELKELSEKNLEHHARMLRYYEHERRWGDNSAFVRDSIISLFSILQNWSGNASGIELELMTTGIDDDKYLPFNRWLGLHHHHVVSFGPLANIPAVDDRPPSMPTNKHRAFRNDPPRYILAQCEPLPVVPCITSFRILRRNYSDINEFSRLAIIQSLPNVREVSHERWNTYHPMFFSYYTGIQEGAEPCFLMSRWPTSVKSMFFFQAVGDMFTKTHRSFSSQMSCCIDYRGVRRWVHRGLAPRSLELEELGMCYTIVDARLFFEHWGHGTKNIPTWPHLRLLTMTADILCFNSNARIRRLLLRLASFAKKMPALEIFEIFYATNNHGARFQVAVLPDKSVKIHWVSTYHFRMGSAVRKAWESAFMTEYGHTRAEILPEEELDDGAYTGPIEFISANLQTAKRILNPQTLEDLANMPKVGADWDPKAAFGHLNPEWPDSWMENAGG